MSRNAAAFGAMALILLTSITLGCDSRGGSADEDDSAARIEIDRDDPFAAIDRLADELKRNSAIARAAEASAVPFGQGEGALHVLRLMRRAIDEEIAWADTDHPYFQVQDERYAKLALGNPDNLYLVSRVDDDAVYRITGRIGSTADFNIQLYQGYPGVQRPFTAHGSLGIDRLVTDSEGRFEVIVGGPKRDSNWIELKPHSRRILVRYTYGDWTEEHAGEIAIERIGASGEPAGPISNETVARRIDAAAVYLTDAMTGYLATVDQVYAGLSMNSLRALRQNSGSAGGLSNQYLSTGRYQLRDDQALIVTTRPSDAHYQGFQIGTEWFEALDFANQTTSLNTRQARLSSDGLYHYVISVRDPGVANWLDASAAPQGQMLLRWQRVGDLGEEHEPRVSLVEFDSVRQHFPADEPAFGIDERREQIAARQRAIQRRYGLWRR